MSGFTHLCRFLFHVTSCGVRVFFPPHDLLIFFHDFYFAHVGEICTSFFSYLLFHLRVYFLWLYFHVFFFHVSSMYFYFFSRNYSAQTWPWRDFLFTRSSCSLIYRNKFDFISFRNKNILELVLFPRMHFSPSVRFTYPVPAVSEIFPRLRVCDFSA